MNATMEADPSKDDNRYDATDLICRNGLRLRVNSTENVANNMTNLVPGVARGRLPVRCLTAIERLWRNRA